MVKKLILACVLMHAFLASAQKNPAAEINAVLDGWHKAAAEADFKTYFSFMAADAVFIGTDPTENWTIDAFKSFSKPYFDRGKAWNFKPVERNVYFSTDGKTAWFDELLDTWMKVCRGSGVLRKEKDGWKIVHYTLSMTVPNEHADAVIELKKDYDDKILLEKK